MTATEFKDAYQKGLGRAWFHVRSLHGDDSTVRKILERCCIEDIRYDKQCECSRCRWEYEILKMTKAPEVYENFILRELPKLTESRDLDHALDLLQYFAEDGSDRARATIHEWFEQNDTHDSYVGGSQVVALDGLDGFVKVAKIIGERLGRDELASESESGLIAAIEDFGKEEVLRRLEEASKTDPAVKRYRNEVMPRYRERCKPSPKYSPPTVEEQRKELEQTFDEFLLKIENGEGRYPYSFARYGSVATEEVAIILDKMEFEKRPEQLVRYVWFFRRYSRNEEDQMPEKVISFLLRLLNSESEDLFDAVVKTLSSQDDWRIRDAAIKLLKSSSSRAITRGFTLIEESAEQNDSAPLAEILKKFPADITPHECHSIVMSLLQITSYLRINHSFISALLTCFTLTPCSMCRENVYERLQKAQAVPKNLSDEYQYDVLSFLQ